MKKNVSVVLDVWRILACIFVFVGHGFVFFHITPFKDASYFFYFQDFAVLIFVILSGFLNTYSLDNTNRSFFRWGGQRVVRIYSYYIPALLVVALIDALHWPLHINFSFINEYNIQTFICNILMLNSRNWSAEGIASFASMKPLWTLVVEWWLNQVHAFLVLEHKHKSYDSIISYLKDGIVLILLMGYLATVYHVQYVVFAYLLGIVVYRIYQELSAKGYVIVLGITLVGIVASGVVYKQAYNYIVLILLVLLFLCTLVWANRSDVYWVNDHTQNVLLHLRNLTFPIYMIHYTIFTFVVEIKYPNEGIRDFFVAIVISVLVSYVILFMGNANRKIIDKLVILNKGREV
ncbi:acyltransferase family protein [Butyrivibrio sp. XPD2006]|uniref:acyltransferase family protein n=1 Tax=Butyrivibrio sp. XPD2006 TaxID=1280668 RepID=UPI0003B3687D|nr:acyltransferase family protein [Butyrivibrio sp. XPD2006]